MSRYILTCVAEDLHIGLPSDPNLIPGNWNGAGAHYSFSTIETRAPGGIKAIDEAIERLRKNRLRHIQACDPRPGKDSERRLVGRLKTCSTGTSSAGVADRGASVLVQCLMISAVTLKIVGRLPTAILA